MNVIAADMCTNARRVRKRWLPKIKSMLPDGMEVYQGSSVPAGVALPMGVQVPYESDFKNLLPSGLTLDQRIYAERKDLIRTHSLLDASDLPAEETLRSPRAKEEPEEDEEETNGTEGMLGAPPDLPRVEGGVCETTPPAGLQQEEEEEFVEGLRINGQ